MKRVKAVGSSATERSGKSACTMLGKTISVVMGLLMLGCATTGSANYSQHPETEGFITEMVETHGFEREQLQRWLANAEKRQNILDAIARPAERTKTWKEYRPIFIVPLRIENGVKFWQENHAALARAEKQYGVPPEYIVAIIGVETNYGRNTGSHRVIDALATLAFDYPPRSPFFRKELQNYFLLTREQKQDPLAFKGSYAGAMGYGQFMPSSYRAYAVDFDGDGFTDIWNNTTDSIGSVANYFKQHGWQAGKPVVSRVRPEDTASEEKFNDINPPTVTVAEWKKRGYVPITDLPADAKALIMKLDGQHGEEYWLGLQNFYVISRYNRSHMYSMAVHQLSQLIREKKEASE